MRPEMSALERRLAALKPLIPDKRRPLFVEFAGTPKAGKTSTLSAINRFFNRNGVNSIVYQERASVSPLSTKGSTNFNVWVTCATLLGMLEALENEKLDVIILDRGLFDGLVWNDWQEQTLRMGKEEAAVFRSFALLPRWKALVDAVVLMHADPETALAREHANQVTVKPGSVMNQKTLAQLRRFVLRSAKRYRRNFPSFFVFDTSNRSGDGIGRTNMGIANKLLDVFHDFLDEEVLCVPTQSVAPLLDSAKGRVFVPKWNEFRALIEAQGKYVRRSKAEKSDVLTQIIPACVIEYRGQFLTNLRHEPGETLHDTLANWAGGHVRRQDLGGGTSRWQSVLTGLEREIAEELALVEWPTAPREVGIVHTTETSRAARHLGVVFMTHLEDPYTARMVQWQKIKERPGRHVWTEWMTCEQMAAAEPRQKEWSQLIGRYLAAQAERRRRRARAARASSSARR